jgi:iron complex transport system substrate-binding protein
MIGQHPQRIVSFLPSATEMVFALGLGDRLMGVSHECDYPPEAKCKPVVVRAVLPVEIMSQSEIDIAVTQRLREGLSLYQLEEWRIRDIAPDLILTQDLCQVCAASGNDVSKLLATLPIRPRILSMTPKSLDGIFGNLRELGQATGASECAQEVICAAQKRLAGIAAKTRQIPQRPRVFCMEWMDPVYCSGHWVPEMVELAGGTDELGLRGSDSVRIAWEDVRRWAPEVLIVMPCGFDLEQTMSRARALFSYPGWSEIPAVRAGRVYAVNANSYFARPGPRVVDGAELLAHLLHPTLFSWNASERGYQRLTNKRAPAMAIRSEPTET